MTEIDHQPARVKSRDEKLREYVREVPLYRSATQATDKVRESGALDKAQDAQTQVRRNPLPFAAVVAAGCAIVGVILILRGRRL